MAARIVVGAIFFFDHEQADAKFGPRRFSASPQGRFLLTAAA